MRLLLDFGAIKSGGGAQLAINFVEYLQKDISLVNDLFFIMPKVGPLAGVSDLLSADTVWRSPNSYLRRIFFEKFDLQQVIARHGISHIFTFFGAGLPRDARVKSIVSCAYPIICYPDSFYWKYVPLKKKLEKQAVNVLRRHRLRSADIVIAETDVMASRLAEFAGILTEKIRVVPPSPSIYIDDVSISDRRRSHGEIKFLFLSGLDFHKNLWRLPELAVELKNLGLTNFSFRISVEKEAYISSFRQYCLDKYDIIEEHFRFLGGIHPREIQTLYEKADFIVSLSDLESYSNNYMEAWKTATPMICGDTDFARKICGDSACFVPQHLPKTAAKCIVDFVADHNVQERNLANGKKALAQLPSLGERYSMVMDIIRSA